MYRAVIVASLLATIAVSARAAELCVTCDEPTATYRCTVEQVSGKVTLGATLEEQMCNKVLAKKGTHKSCHLAAVPQGGTCAGLERTVTVTDYQRALSASGESTYEVGAFEIARENVHNTWVCVTSMFKDC
jgi:hypothetical protein